MQLVLCAAAPDTEELARRLRGGSPRCAGGGTVVWLEERFARPHLVQLLTHARVVVCRRCTSRLGIVNLEAMACETAVVRPRVGGIPEVVADGETGVLVPPGDAGALAAAIDALLAEPERAAELGVAGRRRVLERFGWRSVAERTAALYERLSS